MKACYYARVSTEEEKQANALKKQCEEARAAITENGWALPDGCEYIDEGKSGTTTQNRDEYLRLFNDIDKDKFDIIVIKSQDRLMRSAKDWYLFLSRITENHKKLYIYLDRRFYESDDSLIAGIKAILAEEYSRELSKKLNNANKNRQKSGSSIITNGRLWGYIQKDGELFIHEDEATVVRRIFDMYCNGNGIRKIKNILDKEGLVSRHGTQIGLTTLKRMIRNPVYIGTVIQNKQHVDFHTKKITQNSSEDWHIHENRVPAIIDREVWERANLIMDQKTIENERPTRRGVNKGVYALSSKIVCSECGAKYHRTTYKEKGVLVPYWICATYQLKGRKHPKGRPAKDIGCDGRNIKEEILFCALREIAEKYDTDILPSIQKAIGLLKETIEGSESSALLDSLIKKKEQTQKLKSVLLDKLLDGIINDKAFGEKNAEIDTKILRIDDEIKAHEKAIIEINGKEERLHEIGEVLSSADTEEDTKFRLLLSNINKITVHPQYADIEFDFFGKTRITGSLSRCDLFQKGKDTLRITLSLSKRYSIPYEFRIISA